MCSKELEYHSFGNRVQVKGKLKFTYIHTYFIYLYTVKSSVYITVKSFISTTLFYKIPMWEPNLELLYSWSIFLLKYARESDFCKLMGKLFHNSASL